MTFSSFSIRHASEIQDTSLWTMIVHISERPYKCEKWVPVYRKSL
jgi:hypothetical protein